MKIGEIHHAHNLKFLFVSTRFHKRIFTVILKCILNNVRKHCRSPFSPRLRDLESLTCKSERDGQLIWLEGLRWYIFKVTSDRVDLEIELRKHELVACT